MTRLLARLLALLLALTPAALARPPSDADLRALPWARVLARAKGQTVNFYLWGGSDNINRYVDRDVAAALRPYGVTLRRVPLGDTVEAVNKVLGEKTAGRNAGGAVDLIWINGENFKTARQGRLLFEGWAEKLPNARLVDWKNPAVRNDFGYPVNGAESPWGSTQWQYVYDGARVKASELPRSFAALARWAKANPGRFTFPAPPAFYGNRFLRMALFELGGGPAKFAGPFDEARWKSSAPKLWSYLEDLRPHLWRGGRTFPNDIAQQYALLANGEIDFAFVQNKAGIAAEVASGQLPKTARVYLFDAGTVADHHYVAIPYNAAHKAAAMVVANVLLSPELQLKKLSGDVWGDGLAIDPRRVGGDFARRAAAALKVGPYTLAPEKLAGAAFGDAVAEYDKRVQDGFRERFLR